MTSLPLREQRHDWDEEVLVEYRLARKLLVADLISEKSYMCEFSGSDRWRLESDVRLESEFVATDVSRRKLSPDPDPDPDPDPNPDPVPVEYVPLVEGAEEEIFNGEGRVRGDCSCFCLAVALEERRGVVIRPGDDGAGTGSAASMAILDLHI